VTLKEFRGKYIVYDKNGIVVIITRDKKIAVGFARSKK
tara:strand:- start:420 stop:533 length:114 start_codon:yes stop_codon:yes gene_type:complete